MIPDPILRVGSLKKITNVIDKSNRIVEIKRLTYRNCELTQYEKQRSMPVQTNEITIQDKPPCAMFILSFSPKF
jgi:hypothetical protein